MDPKELLELSKAAEIIYKSNGINKKISSIEKKTAKFAFSSVVSIKDIDKGEKFSLKNLWVKRPGTGDFPAYKIKILLGKKAKQKILKNKPIKKKNV